MASYHQTFYCKNCKKNVTMNENGHCKICNSSQLNKFWSVRFRYINEEGKEVNKKLSGYKTKKDANAEYLKFISKAKQYVKKEKIVHELTFPELYEEYKNHIKARIKESSFYDFNSKCNLHILPYFSKYKVKDISPKTILNWQNSKNKYSYKYKTNLRTYLSSILKYAQRYYKIENQLLYVENFRNIETPKEMKIWTPEEFFNFVSEIKNIVYKSFFYSLYFTGARKGEILATTWLDWDLDNGILNITKTISKKVYDSQWSITSPKNKSSIRKIPLPKILIEVMKEYKEFYNQNNMMGFVFYGNKPLADSSIGKQMNLVCKEKKVTQIRLHDFRHSHASLLLSKGISIVAVSKRLGHSSTKQTLDTYAHLMPQEAEILLNILDNLT